MFTSSVCRITTVACLLSILFVPTLLAEDDYWMPKGLPLTDAGRMKTMEMVEPRQEITELPFMITNSGSYYLIRSLHGVAGSNGIEVMVSDVRVDLNGFVLTGGSNSLTGVAAPSGTDNIMICNGVIRDWGNYAIHLPDSRDASLYNIKAQGSGLDGIWVGVNSHIERCNVYTNGYRGAGDGMYVGDGSTIRDCKANNNKAAGFNVLRSVKLTGCTASENMKQGIWGYHYTTIRDCVATRNYLHGIAAYDNCMIKANNCGENGSVQSGQATVYGAGIHVAGSGNRIEDNNVPDNDYGIWVESGSRNLIIRNSATGNPQHNYSTTAAGDYFGHVYNTNALDSGTTGFVADNPWSNFEF